MWPIFSALPSRAGTLTAANLPSSGVVAAQVLMASWAAVLLLFFSTVVSFIDQWSQSRTFAHGFLVLPAVLYLLWCERGRWAIAPVQPSYWAFPVLALLGGGWLAGHISDLVLLEQMAVLGMLVGVLWASVGSRMVRRVLFPLGLLLFALPVGTSLEPWLQAGTAWFVVTGLKLLGIPVFWEGNSIAIPTGNWEVARDCGGLRYVLPGMALGYLFTSLTHRRFTQRVGFLFVCLCCLILANGFRAFGIVLGDHLGIAEGTDHRVFSYSVYCVTLSLLFWFGHSRKAGTGSRDRPGSSTEPSAAPVRVADRMVASPLPVGLAALGGVALLATAPCFAWLYRLLH